MAELMKILQYAKHAGVSDALIHREIKEGKIKEGVVLIKGKRWIDPDIADAERAKHKDPTHRRVTRRDKEEGRAKVGDGDTPTMTEVKLKQEVIRTKKMHLEYEKKKGTLVEKDAVYKALFDYAQEIRIEVESIPDKVVDDMLAAADRHRARTILSEAIEDALLALSKQVNIR